MKASLSVKLSSSAFAIFIATVENTTHPLGDLCRSLWESSLKDASQTALGTSIAALLQDGLLPNPPQRLVAIYILYDMIVSRHNLATLNPAVMEKLIDSPLTIILFELINDTDSRSPEQLFLSHLLSHSQSNENDLPMIGQISKASAKSLWSALEDAIRSGASVATLNISSIRKMWLDKHPEQAHKSHGLTPVSAVVPDPDPYVVTESGQLADELGDVVTLEDFSPTFLRPPPPFLPIAPDSRELRWIDPEPLHEVIWDPEMGMKGERGSELREIITRAMKSPITDAQRMKVLQELQEDPKLVHLCGLTPRKLPELVNHNSMLAGEILLKLASSNQMPKYLSALVNMEMNLHSMEVVIRLSSTVELPSDFMHTYISNCIRSCNNFPDKYGQIRMVRFVCVFLKTLIKNKTIDVKDLSIEVQAFCIEYSRFVFSVFVWTFLVHVMDFTNFCLLFLCYLVVSEFAKLRTCSDL